MKTQDLFAGCSVTTTPHEDVWLASLHTDALKTVSMCTYHELPEAIEAVDEWTLILSDDTEIVPMTMLASELPQVLAEGKVASQAMDGDKNWHVTLEQEDVLVFSLAPNGSVMMCAVSRGEWEEGHGIVQIDRGTVLIQICLKGEK